jgi:hypothetical protein
LLSYYVPTHISIYSSISTVSSCNCYPRSTTDCFALFGFIKITKKIQKNKEKIIKVFARFLENVLYFCRSHSTSVIGANFCGCIFCDPCSEKNIKNSKKYKKVWFLHVPIGKIREKFSKKEKFRLFACSVCSFHRPLFSPSCATSRHVLASSYDLYFGFGLNNH